MREYVLNPGGGSDESALYIGRMPGRKRLALCIRRGTRIRTVAHFRDDADAEEADELLSRMLHVVAVRRTVALADEYTAD